jgi:hypothetical protein
MVYVLTTKGSLDVWCIDMKIAIARPVSSTTYQLASPPGILALSNVVHTLSPVTSQAYSGRFHFINAHSLLFANVQYYQV